MSRHDSKSPEIRRADFPVLREFLRGYLHQDMQEEYGSVEDAAKRFSRDADAEQRQAAAEEWRRLTAHFKDRSLAELNRALTRELGSAQLLAAADLEKISTALNG
jgi:hypothetical protein